MKKLFVTALAVSAINLVSQAQISNSEKAPMQQEKKMSKEEKEAMKTKKEAELVQAFQNSDFTAEQQVKAREILDEASKKSKEVKTNTTLTEDAKKTKLKEISDEKNAKLKVLVGDAKLKAFQRIQKSQRESVKSENAVAPTVPVKE